MKKRHVLAAMFLFALSLNLVAHFSLAGIEDPPVCGPFAAGMVDAVPATASMGVGLNYSTGFEAGEGFIPGYIGGGTQPVGCGGVANPCWGTTMRANRSLIEGHIETAHPFAGLQHLRISHDPAAPANSNFGLGVDARYPRTEDLSPQPVAPNTVTMRISIDARSWQSFRVQPQSNSQGFLASSMLLHYMGGVYFLDGCGDTPEWANLNGWFPGAYHWLQIELDPCNNEIAYIFRSGPRRTTCIIGGTNLEQILIFGDNQGAIPGGSPSNIDVDELILQTGAPCPVYGACCDTNGLDAGCVDSVLEGDCTGLDKNWTANTLCADIACACLPDCVNRECGDDGCGGSCGTCDDGIDCTIDACGGDANCSFTPNHAMCVNNTVCDGYEFCSPQTGCVPGNPLFCDDGEFCNGAESCDSASGCVAGTNPCPEDTTCNEDTDACDPNSIPTVSEWGLIVLAILLLVVAKVQFGRVRRV